MQGRPLRQHICHSLGCIPKCSRDSVLINVLLPHFILLHEGHLILKTLVVFLCNVKGKQADFNGILMGLVK